MSGPKSSHYTLTVEQRRLLAEQRKIAQQKEKEKAKINIFVQEMLLLSARFSEDDQKTQELFRLTGSDDDYVQKLSDLKRTAKKLESLMDIGEDASLEEVKRAASIASVEIIAVRKKADELQKVESQNTSRLHNELQMRISKGFSSSFADIPSPNKQKEHQRSEMELQLLTYSHDRRLSKQLSDRVKKALKSLSEDPEGNTLNNYHALTYAPLQKACEQGLLEYEQCHEEYEQLIVSYRSLCTINNVTIKDTECSAQAVAFLKDEIAAMDKQYAEDDERFYISKSMDDVMAEIGYSILGHREIKKKNGSHFTSDLYHYGDGTAISVTYAEDGKISLELGGLDNKDRIPDELETYQLCEDMQLFCDSFSEIERRLAAKGVLVKNRISILPPISEYAQIINITDYNQVEDADTFNVQRIHLRQDDKLVMKEE